MRRMIRFCVVLLLLVLTSGQVGAQDSEIITVTGLYVELSSWQWRISRDIDVPCDSP